MPVTLDFPPRLMTAAQAAHYLGVSISTLRTLGIPRKILGSKRLYDRLELEAFADDLADDSEASEVDRWFAENDEVNTCDALFGDTKQRPRRRSG